MMKGKTLTPILLAGIFVLMLGLSFAAVPLYDLFCRVTGFGGTTQVSKEAPNIVLDKVVSVRFDTNVNKKYCFLLSIYILGFRITIQKQRRLWI